MADQLLSALSIDVNLGLPSTLKRAVAPGGATNSWIDHTNGNLQPVAASRMLGPSMWALHNQLSDNDFNDVSGSAIVFSYAVEQLGVDLQRSAAIELSTPYRPPSTSKVCRVGYEGKSIGGSLQSLGAYERGLDVHTQGVNANVSIGVSREVLHGMAVQEAAQLDALFVRMWLIHLSVLAGRPVTVTVDAAAHRISLGGVNVEDESDRARLLEGARFNGKQFDRPTTALVVAACSDISSLQGIHSRAGRYRFPTTPLTLYGTTQVGLYAEQLVDARSTASMIVGLSNRYDAGEASGRALRTALLMFGLSNAGGRIMIKCSQTEVHDDMHASVGGSISPHDRCNELSEMRMLSLSLFVARVYVQTLGHILRAGLLKVTALDVDAARDAILPGHGVLMREAGALHEELLQDYGINMSSSRFLRDNYRMMWDERGVLHSLAAGLLVEGSVLEDAIKPIAVPQISALSQTDDPNFAPIMKKDWGALTLIESILVRGGEDLSGSWASRVDALRGPLVLSQDTRNLCGSTVGLTVLSMGQYITIQRGSSGMLMDPAPSGYDGTKPAVVPEITPQAFAAAAAPEVGGDNILDELLTKFTPQESVVSRRPELSKHKLDTAEAPPLVIPDGGRAKWVADVKAESWGVVETPGNGLMCGAAALNISLTALGSRHTLPAVSLSEITEALTSALPAEAETLMRQAGEAPTGNNFTADQMAAGLARLGNYALQIIDEQPSGEVRIYVHGNDTGSAMLVPVHNSRNHWSGVGPGGYRSIVFRS